MQACDRATSERFGVPSIELMHAASLAAASVVREQFPRARRVTVLCGTGNNGGDGMMTARLLADAGLDVAALLLGEPEKLSGDAAQAWLELNAPVVQSPEKTAAGHKTVLVVSAAEDLAKFDGALHADLIVDAIVGTGFHPPLRGLPLAALEWVKAGAARYPVPILAVDLPSGWPADEGSALMADAVFPADAVVTFTAPKPAHVFGQLTRRWDQPVVVAPIGSPDEAVVSGLNVHWAGGALELVQTPRAAVANKGNFGHVLVVGGTFGTAGGKAGAPAMTAMAALRSGAGLVTAAVPAPALALVSSFAPELMTWPLAVNAAGCLTAESLIAEIMEPLMAGKTVLAFGPGLGQNPDTEKFAFGFLSDNKLPVVVDADGLNLLAQKPVLLARMAQVSTVVLTPHPGEMARLAGISVAEVQADRLGVALGFAQRKGVIVVLKGARTLIAHPDGRVAVNTSGNPGMAKGGSGDLLTGIVAGLMAQYPQDVARAVEAAVYLHGLAADLAVQTGDEHTLLATDALSHLSAAFRFPAFHFRSGSPNGYVWLQGALREAALREGEQ